MAFELINMLCKIMANLGELMTALMATKQPMGELFKAQLHHLLTTVMLKMQGLFDHLSEVPPADSRVRAHEPMAIGGQGPDRSPTSLACSFLPHGPWLKGHWRSDDELKGRIVYITSANMKAKTGKYHFFLTCSGLDMAASDIEDHDLNKIGTHFEVCLTCKRNDKN